MRTIQAASAILLAAILIWVAMLSVLPKGGDGGPGWAGRLLAAGLFAFLGATTAYAGLSLWRRRHEGE